MISNRVSLLKAWILKRADNLGLTLVSYNLRKHSLTCDVAAGNTAAVLPKETPNG